MRLSRAVFFTVFLCLGPHMWAQTPKDAEIQADVQRALNNKRFADVHVAVQDEIVSLSGSVALYSAKEEMAASASGV